MQNSSLYSYNGNYPEPLPKVWEKPKPNSMIIENFDQLSNEELESYGWKGPIDVKSFLPYSQELIWDSNNCEYVVRDFSYDEIHKRIQYGSFWNIFIDSTYYTRIKEESKVSLEVNVIATELIALLMDAKNNNANAPKIESSINEILRVFPPTQEEMQDLLLLFESTGMSEVYQFG